mgnify:CR=1 FL=1
MNHYNQITIEGRLTRDPERRATGSGIAVLKFSIACNKAYKPEGADWKESVSYVPCVMFGKSADYAAAKLRKGLHVLVGGSLEQKRWEDNQGTKREAFQINVERLRVLEKTEGAGSDEPVPAPVSGDYPDDDIPF